MLPNQLLTRVVNAGKTFDVADCCINLGYTKMTGYLDRKFAVPTDQLAIKAFIDNTDDTDGPKRVSE